MADTTDLVHESITSLLSHADRFNLRHEGALEAYLRQVLVNRIRDEVRRAQRREVLSASEPIEALSDESPLELALGRESVAHYEDALARLDLKDRELIVARIELQQSYEQISARLGVPTTGSARLAVARAMRRLVEVMRTRERS
jgi:RNA polymerase sigma factor (sigma-70 family)